MRTGRALVLCAVTLLLAGGVWLSEADGTTPEPELGERHEVFTALLRGLQAEAGNELIPRWA